MPTEAEKRLRRCCFCGPSQEGMDFYENEVLDWLEPQVRQAVRDGYRTFLCGMRKGVDLQAGHMIREIKEKDSSIRLICVEPWPGLSEKWDYIWQSPHDFLMDVSADHVKVFSKTYYPGVLREADEYLVDHCARLVAYYDDKTDEIWEMMAYAVRQGVEVVTNRPDLVRDYRAALERPGKYGLPE